MRPRVSNCEFQRAFSSVMSLPPRLTRTFHDFVAWWGRHPQLTALVLGQALSLLITATGVFSQLLSTKYNVNVPTAQSTLNYLLLAIVYGILYFRRVPFWATLKEKWFVYFPLAFVDVEANYFGTKCADKLGKTNKNNINDHRLMQQCEEQW